MRKQLRGASLLRYRLSSKPRHGRRLPPMPAEPFLPFIEGASELNTSLTKLGFTLLRCVHPYQRRSGEVTVQLHWSRRAECDLTDTHSCTGIVPPLVVLSLVES